MKHHLSWKGGVLISILLLMIVYALPNLFGEDPAVQIYSNEANLAKVLEQVNESLNKAQIAFHSAKLEKNERILIRFTNTEAQLKAKEILSKQLPENCTVALNLATRNPRWLRVIGAHPMKLGLDLRGGVHFLLSLDTSEMMNKREIGIVRAIASKLRAAMVRYQSVVRQEPHGVSIYFRESSELKKGLEVLAKNFPDYVIEQINEQGQYRLSARISEAAVAKLNDYTVEQTMAILRNRVNELGISEAVVQRQGENGISVDLPGIQDTARAKELLGKTATLEFHLLDEEHNVEEALSGNLPLGSRLYYYNGQPLLLKDQVVLQGNAINYAMANYSQFGQPVVQVRLSAGEEGNFARMTSENIGCYLAVVYTEHKNEFKKVNGTEQKVKRVVEKVISVARIQSALGGQFEITGLSEAYARNLALLLRAGSLIVPVTVEQEITVGPNIGQNNIYKGMLSIVIGYACIMVFMGLYYRTFGWIANLALIMNLIFVSAIMSLLGATLTMPGIAGMVLTAGLAVDACVLIFERIREELRLGANIRNSINAGYQRALTTIIDANMATLIVALVLFAFGDGAVKGFAVTLVIGLLGSMLTTIVYSRAIVNGLFLNRSQVNKLPIGN